MALKGFRPDASEMVSLTERAGYLQALRIGFSVVVLGSAIFAKEIVGRSLTDVLLVTTGYIVLAALVEAVRKGGRGRRLPLIGGMILVDGLYLAWALYLTGGTQSPLRFLVYLHLIGVALLASYRTGLKIALWHSLLFFVVFYAQAAELIAPNEGAAQLSPNSPEFVRASVYNVMAFWLVALGTSFFSSLNERELRKRKGDFQDLVRMATELENVNDPAGISRTLLDSVCESFGFKRGVVLGAPGGQDAPVLAYRGPGDGSTVHEGVDPSIERAWATKKPLLVKELKDEDRKLQSLMPFAKNVIVTPLTAEGHEVVGALVLEYPRVAGRRIEKRIVDMVTQFAAHAALALRNAHLLGQVQKMADTDGLTGLANRRSFEKTLDREISRATRNGESVTLMMVDVDHFKDFNDRHGHQAGDKALQLVASALVHACRDFDTPARYGGEEFAIILPSCSSNESLRVGDRLRHLVAELEAESKITASAGVATFPAHASDAEGLIRAADEALYESKRAGRDRITRSKRKGVTRAASPVAAKKDAKT